MTMIKTQYGLEYIEDRSEKKGAKGLLELIAEQNPINLSYRPATLEQFNKWFESLKRP